VKILQLFNQYRSLFNGEERVVEMTAALLARHGHDAELWTRSSRGLESSLAGKVQATFSAVYNPSARREMEARLKANRPDVVHAHNLYPQFSPAVLATCRKRGVPTVMTVHNHINTCPRSDHLLKGSICERCVGGREYHCVLQNCRGNLLESAAYAARSAIARRLRLFVDNVTTVIALNDFMGKRLVGAGFRPEQIVVLPNMVEMAEEPADASIGGYAAFSGRISTEKGIDTLLAAAAQAADVPVRLAGGGPLFDEMQARATPNVVMHGQLHSEQMATFYRGARFLVLPTKCFEGCPLVISEAMNHGLPVIASRIGGIPELIDDGVTGFLFEPGNAPELTAKIQTLWNSPALCRQMGLAGRAKAEREFGETAYHNRLLEIYRGAIQRVHATCSRKRAETLTAPAEPETALAMAGPGDDDGHTTFN
jgi:glycosyltransferase involved in cell wall biosynthesis